MQVSLLANATPAFLSKNFLNREVDRESGIFKSTNWLDDLHFRFYDFDRGAPNATTGSNNSTQERLEFKFYEGALAVSRGVDYIAAYGINWEDFEVQYSVDDGANWLAIPGGAVSGFSGTDFRLSLATPVTGNRIRFLIDTVQSGSEKSVGHIVLAEGLFQPLKGPTDFFPVPQDGFKDVENADHSQDSAQVLRSDNSNEFYKTRMSFVGILKSQKDSFRVIKTLKENHILLPEPGNEPTEAFLGRITPGTFRLPYTTARVAQPLHDVSFEWEEMGGG